MTGKFFYQNNNSGQTKTVSIANLEDSETNATTIKALGDKFSAIVDPNFTMYKITAVQEFPMWTAET